MIEDIVKSHRSIRKFKPMPLDMDEIISCLETAQSASTSSFIQAYSAIIITDPEKRKSFYEISGQQQYVLDAPVFIVFIMDFGRVRNVFENEGKQMPRGYAEMSLTGAVDAAIFAQTFLLVCESKGLSGVYIGAVRNDTDKASDLLELGDMAFPLFGMCIGYADQSPIRKPRIPKQLIIFENSYPKEYNSHIMESYDMDIRGYYIARTHGKLEQSYSELMLDKFQGELRPHIEESLRKKGFLK